jgi:hypothetical protein
MRPLKVRTTPRMLNTILLCRRVPPIHSPGFTYGQNDINTSLRGYAEMTESLTQMTAIRNCYSLACLMVLQFFSYDGPLFGTMRR